MTPERACDDSTAQRAHLNHDARPLLAHERNHRARHPQSAEDVHVELTLDGLDGSLFHGSPKHEPGVVDHRVDAALALEHQPHAARHRSVVRHVELEQRAGSSEIGPMPAEITHACIDPMTILCQALADQPPEPPRGAGDQADAHKATLQS